MVNSRWRSAAAMLAGLGVVLGIATGAGRAATSPAADLPKFTQAQADTGKALYSARCSNCHGASLEGVGTPALTGRPFIRKWLNGTKTVGDLYAKIHDTMPMMAPHSLPPEQYGQITAFILAKAGYTAGKTPLVPGAKAILKPPVGGPLAEGTAVTLPALPETVERATTSAPDDSALARSDDGDWLMYNRSFSGTRYSALEQINTATARNLRPKCIFQAGEVGTFQTSPVIYDGMMYLTTAWTTYAVDPTTCRTLWTSSYPPDADAFMTGIRGVAIYRGKVFRATPDGHLLAIDAKTGRQLWDVWVANLQLGYSLAAAPVAYDGKVFIGEAGAEWGNNAHVYAFDADTGRKLWSFNTIPQGKEVGAASWGAGAEHGGGSMWTSFALQPEKGLLYVSVGNPAPDYDGAMRPGDNLFTNSVVVLDYRTGKLIWYAQQIPHDTHDWDTAAAPILYDLSGKDYMAVANKGGWLYIYDRRTHDLIAKTEVTTHENIDVPLTPAGIHHCPGVLGGVQWNGPAYSPRQKLLYVNSVDWCGTTHLAETRFVQGRLWFGGDYVFDPADRAKGWTRAIDAATGKPAWARQSATPMTAGVTPTAGDVLLTGDLNGNFLVLDSRSGAVLYSFNTGGAIAGGVSTYLVGGKQHVAVVSGNSSRTVWKTPGAATVVVFALDGR